MVSSDNYYPFGLEMPGRSYTGNNPHNFYKYSGKELDKEKGLGWWHVTDAADQFLSPYLYSSNDPIGLIDTDGNFE